MASIFRWRGTNEADTLFGVSTRISILKGLGGNDLLLDYPPDISVPLVFARRDTLMFGGSGDDRLVSLGGKDVLHGGDGDDTFEVHWLNYSKRHVFGDGGDDTLELFGFDASATVTTSGRKTIVVDDIAKVVIHGSVEHWDFV